MLSDIYISDLSSELLIFTGNGNQSLKMKFITFVVRIHISSPSEQAMLTWRVCKKVARDVTDTADS